MEDRDRFELSWDHRKRQNKFEGYGSPFPTWDEKGINKGEKVHFIDKKSKEIKQGNAGFFCGTVRLFHMYDDKKKCCYCAWNDIEPLTDEGYNVLAERLKTMKETS